MTQVLAIAIGGAVGALARYWISVSIYTVMGRDFPWGTLGVNVLGSACMGLMFAYVSARADTGSLAHSAIMVGFLGAFTTFSTFSLETLNIIEAGHLVRALANALASVIVCVVVCWGGVLLGRVWFTTPA